MYDAFVLDQRKYNSVSSLSSFIERHLSKVIIALPTNKTVMVVFWKTVTGEFSYVYTRLGFETEILMPNYTSIEYNKMTVGESFRRWR